MKISIAKSELEILSQVFKDEKLSFGTEKINDTNIYLTFNSIDEALKFDEFIKDQLVYQGFDKNYNPNKFGKMCESIIDKMYNILK